MAKYPTGVEPNGGNLRIWFAYQGVRRRESLGVPDTPKNRKMAGELRANVMYQIKTGTFNYQESFPDSPLFRHSHTQESEITMGQLAARWLKLKEPEIAHSTYCTYERRVRKTIEMLGPDRAVGSVKSEDLLNLRRELLTGPQLPGRMHSVEKQGRSVATVNGCMTDLSALFKFAFDNGYIPRNPMASIAPLKKDHKKPDPLTRDEFARVIEKCANRQVANLWSLAVLTGLRHGELCALAWEDIDLKAGYLKVCRNLTNEGRFTPPKTRTSTNRIVCLIDSAIEVLKDQMELTRMNKPVDIEVHMREFQKKEQEQCTFVFNPGIYAINSLAGNYYAVASLGQTWKSALRRAGVRHRKAYQSRHTYACWSLSAGANPNFVANQMGHANSQMVYQVYGAWMPENNNEQVSLLNSKLNEFVLHMPYRRTASQGI
ncbi:integrase [Pantoea alhagi]|uniref:Integrase n=1 Tax=Pantoea alhagi TaxID=1891675 RepID=A0A1W6B858_9GAMM|nr:site-specific integrase [Pantoea alhagi]ARJ43249.1 integrase [Pantoea alhagi]